MIFALRILVCYSISTLLSSLPLLALSTFFGGFHKSRPEGGFKVVGQIHFVGQIDFSRKFPMTVKPVFRVGQFEGLEKV